MVVARPHTDAPESAPGLWTLAAGEGAEGDDDGALDGSLRLALEAMVPVDDSPPPPEELRDGDVVLIVDPRAMELMVLRVVR